MHLLSPLAGNGVPTHSPTRSPRLSPAVIAGMLSPGRRAAVIDQLPSRLCMHYSPPALVSRRMLARLLDEELRALCRALTIPEHGHFPDLYLRLARLC
jgi:hypothetical protein